MGRFCADFDSEAKRFPDRLSRGGFPGGSVLKKKKKTCLPMKETQVRSLGQEDLLEREMATHSSILAKKIPRTEEPGVLQSMGSQRARQT